MIAPAYLLFDSLPHAYAAVKTINAVAMSLAALPAYFLARRVLPVGLSLFAAVLTVALPSLLYAGEVMTENVFFPIFLTVVLVFVLTLERPTPARQLLLLGCCVVAYLTRAQALAFFPAIVVAPIVLGTWRSFRVLYGTLGGAALVALVAQLVRGESPLGLLGAYSVAGDYAYEPAEVLRWLVYHVAELDLYVGVFPFAALLVLFALWNRLPRSLRPFLAATATLSTFLLLEVSAFASLPSVQRIEERNLFYLAPLMLIGLLVWVDQGAPRPPLTAGAAAVLAAALPAVIPYERLIGVPSQSDTLLMLALWRVHERWVELDEVVAVVVACSILAALAFLLVPRRFAIVLPLVRARVLPGGRAADLGADGVRGSGRTRRGDAQAGPRVDRPSRGGPRRGRRAVDRQRLALLGVAERVLQPEHRPRLLRGHADGGWAPRDEGDARPRHRRAARRSRRAVRAHGRVRRARRGRRREGRRAQRLPVRGRSLRCDRRRSSRGCTPRTRGRARA